MDKLEEFKNFVKDKPYLANKVKDGTFTWQTLYETYDIFGKDHEFFKDETKGNEEQANNSEPTDNVNKLINNLKKVDGLIDEFRPNISSSSKLATSRIKPFRKYND